MTGDPMSEDDARTGAGELQFDRVVPESGAAVAPDRPSVVCAGCHRSIATEYYDVNGQTFCGHCRSIVEAHAETPRGLGPFLIAGLFGLGAGIAGAIIYYAVMAILHLEIGIVAILIGYMVGYSVRKGLRGRGGLRFQILAAALTYASVAFAYTPIVVKSAIDAEKRAQQAQNKDAGSTDAVAESTTRRGSPAPSGRLLVALLFALGLILALPVMVVVGSLPSGLISAFIIFIGMRQAWRMTGALSLNVLGPYRVGTASAAPSS
jgi:hypothetical protein